MKAVAVARKSAPDLALVNIQLGGRDDGIDLAKQLKALNVPVRLISGQVSRAHSAQTVAIGSMPKPYSALEMAQAVSYLLLIFREVNRSLGPTDWKYSTKPSATWRPLPNSAEIACLVVISEMGLSLV